MSKDAFAKVAYRERPDGLLAVAPQWKRTLADLEGVGSITRAHLAEALQYRPGS